MRRYLNLSGKSGVTAYEVGADRIKVKFGTGRTYLYTYATPGKCDVDEMKRLAQRGLGLCTYISQNVQTQYESVSDRTEE